MVVRIHISPQYVWLESPFLERVGGRGIEKCVPGAPLYLERFYQARLQPHMQSKNPGAFDVAYAGRQWVSRKRRVCTHSCPVCWRKSQGRRRCRRLRFIPKRDYRTERYDAETKRHSHRPNENKLSRRWRERALTEMCVLKSCES